MQIIKTLLDSWKKRFYQQCENTREQQKRYIQKLDEFEERLKNLLSKGDQLYDIHEFMDFIGLPKEAYPYQLEPIYQEKDKLDAEIIENNIVMEKNEKLLLCYKNFFDKIERLENDEMQVLNDRMADTSFLSVLEFYIDISILNKQAKRKNPSFYREDNYVEILNLFSVENMKKIGHPLADNNLYGKKAELINAVCRVSWEWYYLNNLKRKIVLYKPKMLSFNSEYHKLKKKAQKDSIIRAWEKDIELIEQVKDADSFVYAVYSSLLSEDTRREFNRMILDIKYG